jgi:nucleoside-diphosphate kinase
MISLIFTVVPCAHHERTFLMIKPDGVHRGYVGEIIQRFEKKGYQLLGMKQMLASEEIAKQLYAHLADSAFFPDLVKYITSGPVVAMVWEGEKVVKSARAMLGATDPAEAAPGTIRGDLSVQIGRNVMHASNAVDAAKKEFALFFKEEELVDWERVTNTWLF